MKRLTLSEFQDHVPATIDLVRGGESVAILEEASGATMAMLVPPQTSSPPPPAGVKRRLGLLDGRGEVRFAADFKMSAEELLGE